MQSVHCAGLRSRICFWSMCGFIVLRASCWCCGWSLHSLYFLCDPIMTFETKLTMALAGCSGSCSANKWHMFSVSLCDFLATNPKILEDKVMGKSIYTRAALELNYKCQITIVNRWKFSVLLCLIYVTLGVFQMSGPPPNQNNKCFLSLVMLFLQIVLF